MAKTPKPARLRFDVYSAMAVGRREYQEDALATEFQPGAEFGLAVLADGMGGHAAGDVASKIVVGEVFGALRDAIGDSHGFRADIPSALRDAIRRANEEIQNYWNANTDSRGMGATVIALALDGEKLWWLSVGDSPLLLYRDGNIRRLNEDHSLAPQIDYLVLTGQMDPEVGRKHPERSCLTSVLCGDKIHRIDCGTAPLTLLPDDVLIVGSDGIETLDRSQIAEIVTRLDGWPAAKICDAMMEAVEKAGDPDQDNVSLTIIRPQFAARTAARKRRPTGAVINPSTRSKRRKGIFTSLVAAFRRRSSPPREDVRG